MPKHQIYTLTINSTGRTAAESIAAFANGDDATQYGKNKAFELHVNVMHVTPTGDVRIYSEMP